MNEVTTEGSYDLAEVTPMGEDKELSGSYNPAKILDDTARLHVKACGFETNRNNFRFKRKPLELTHRTAFGEQIPAWKSFEGKQVNRNHLAVDNGSKTNEPIGYIEKAYLKSDGVYLDLVLWKRTLTESEQSQLRAGTAHVSMEVEYTNPIKDANGVRTMTENSTISFVGIAVLFDGIQPGDQTSGILATENAALLDMAPVSTERLICVTSEVSLSTFIPPTGVTVENLTPEQIEKLVKELAEAQARAELLETEKSELTAAKEAAEVTAQELESKCQERDTKLAEMYAKESEYMALQAQLNAMRESAFTDNLGKCFDLTKLEADEQAFTRSLFSGCYGEAEVDCFTALACKLVCVAQSASEMVLAACKKEESGEGESECAQGSTTEAATEDELAAAAAAAELATQTAIPTPAPSIAGKKPDEGTKFNLNHLRR
jgi:hypothetical protein